jgi:histidyl-tRNA synthetase
MELHHCPVPNKNMGNSSVEEQTFRHLRKAPVVCLLRPEQTTGLRHLYGHFSKEQFQQSWMAHPKMDISRGVFCSRWKDATARL